MKLQSVKDANLDLKQIVTKEISLCLAIIVLIFISATSVMGRSSYGDNCADCHLTTPTTTTTNNTSTTTITTNTTKTDSTTTRPNEERLIDVWYGMLYVVPTITALILSVLGFVIIKRG